MDFLRKQKEAGVELPEAFRTGFERNLMVNLREELAECKSKLPEEELTLEQ